VLLQEHGVVDDNLRCGDAQVQDAVIHGLSGLWAQGGSGHAAGLGTDPVSPPTAAYLEGAQALLQVSEHRPYLQ
jgi:hypothetical protein